jgi:MFS transporter, DHA3 family, macrolide efflux protein
MLDRLIFQVVLLLTGLLLDLVGLQMMTVVFGFLSLLMTGLFYSRYRQLKTTTFSEQAS